MSMKPLLTLIRRADKTQKDVARALGMSQAHLSGIVAGRSTLTSRHVLPLSRCLGVSAEDVLRAAGLDQSTADAPSPHAQESSADGR